MSLGYNSTETTSVLWNAALNMPQSSGKGRGRTKKSEVACYPQFEQAANHTEDPYWRVILNNCARKKFPRGFTYADGILKHRANNISIILPDDPLALSQTVIYFLQENGKLCSAIDQEIRKRKAENVIIAQLSTAYNDWSCVSRSKNRRATYVADYVEEYYKHLPKHIRDEIYTQINVGFETKYIKKEHITFENGKITHVDGIDADEHDMYFTRPMPTKRPALIERDEQVKDKKHQHYEGWCKYLKDYSDYLISSAKSSHTTIQLN